MSQVETEVKKITSAVREELLHYLRSGGAGGKRIIAAFMEEFEKLSERSPKDDPTNLKNHMDFLENHIKKTLDESLTIDGEGQISLGIGSDETLGFDIDRTKLKHRPEPTVWVVYLIRGIGGRYAFVNNDSFMKKFHRPMPPEYAGGFLVSKRAWINEGWEGAVGPFEQYEHPASGASPVPFFRNVRNRFDMKGLIQDFFRKSKNVINT